MQKRKSRRHQVAANARWRAAEARAELERAEGVPDREPMTDVRLPFSLPFAHLGWRDVRLEPRLGYISWRCVDEGTGEMLRWIAAQVPRQLGSRHLT